jgi:hypothetical protein
MEGWLSRYVKHDILSEFIDELVRHRDFIVQMIPKMPSEKKLASYKADALPAEFASNSFATLYPMISQEICGKFGLLKDYKSVIYETPTAGPGKR